METKKKKKKILSKRIWVQSVKGSWKLWLTLTAILSLMIVVMTTVIHSSWEEGAAQFAMNGITGMEGIYGMMFFEASGMIAIFMIIFTITVGNKLVAGEVDRGTMSFTLNTPTKRRQIILTKALFFITSLTLMVLVPGLIAITVASAIGAKIVVGKVFLLMLGSWLFGLVLSGIAFAASCWFNKSGHAILVGAGAPVAFMVFSMMAGLVKELEFLKYLSLNTLFDSTAIMGSVSGFIGQFIAMGLLAVGLYVAGITKFLKKDLPL